LTFPWTSMEDIMKKIRQMFREIFMDFHGKVHEIP
jgi:hypothetical protein